MLQSGDRAAIAAVGVLCGAAIASTINPSPMVIGACLMIAAAVAVGWLLPLDRRVLLGTVAALLTASWTWAALLAPPTLTAATAITGVVASLPERADRNQRFLVAITTAIEPRLQGRTVELVVPLDVQVLPAHRLECQCTAQSLDAPRQRRLLAQGVSGRFLASTLKLGDRDGHPRWWLLRLRRALVATADRIWPLPESSLAAGLTVGSRESFAPALADAMRETGTTHLVAVSGSNVVLVLWLLHGLLPVRRPRLRFVVLTAILGSFVVLTGGSASVVRAGLMAWVLALATAIGRPVDPLRLLLVVAAGMTLVHPLVLTADLGFQLSFLAVLALVTLAPFIERSLPGPAWARTTVAATLAAYLATLSLIASTFGTVSLVAPLANIAVVALVVPAMVLAILAVVVATVVPIVGGAVGWLTWPVLAAIRATIETAGALPLASVTLRISPWWTAATLVSLLGLGLWQQRANQRQVAQ